MPAAVSPSTESNILPAPVNTGPATPPTNPIQLPKIVPETHSANALCTAGLASAAPTAQKAASLIIKDTTAGTVPTPVPAAANYADLTIVFSPLIALVTSVALRAILDHISSN